MQGSKEKIKLKQRMHDCSCSQSKQSSQKEKRKGGSSSQIPLTQSVIKNKHGYKTKVLLIQAPTFWHVGFDKLVSKLKE